MALISAVTLESGSLIVLPVAAVVIWKQHGEIAAGELSNPLKPPGD
jgi:hypothetical protein